LATEASAEATPPTPVPEASTLAFLTLGLLMISAVHLNTHYRKRR
jgi:hypothetical protein